MISFIIPAHNEEQLLGATLDALHTAAKEIGEPYEVLVVADACTDRTAEVAAAHGACIVPVQHRQIAATRNAGARQANGDVFFFVDADTRASAAAIRAGLRAIRGGAVGGGFLPRFDAPLPLWFAITYPFLTLVLRLLRLTGGCFLFCTRDSFQATAGFCERYYASEETVFIKELKRQGRFVVPSGVVMTSGRKLRAFSAWQVLGPLFRWAIHGPQSFQRREGLEVWYGARRAEEVGPRTAGALRTREEQERMSIDMRAMTPADWDAVRTIYLEGIASGQATFEVETPSWEQWDAAHHPFARLIARHSEEIAGWAALSPVSRRRCYAGVAEVSVYVGAAHRGRGVGSALLRAVIDESERHGIWTLQGATFPENAASRRLQAACEFREIGRRERIAQLHGVWRDTILTERRSGRVGVDSVS